MSKTAIEYVDETWNPVTGCTKISEGCKNCYAERMARRLAGRFGYPEAPHHFDVTLHPERLEEPLKWRRDARILLPSMGDLFHEDVPDDFITSALGITAISSAPFYTHTYLLLTKRPERMREYAERHEPLWAVASIWPGVTVENQDQMWRVEELVKIPATKHWVSLEPMLGPIDVRPHIGGWDEDGHCIRCGLQRHADFCDCPPGFGAKINWVVLSGETGPGARPLHPDWARRVKDDCVAARIPFFFKQWGAWLSASQYMDANLNYGYYGVSKSDMTDLDNQTFYRVGKKAAGRLLDGREWNEMPRIPSD